EDGLDAFVLRSPVKGHRAEEVAVVGDGDGVHPERLDALDELVEPVAAVEEGVLGVEVEMDEPRAQGVARSGSRFLHKMLWRVGHRVVSALNRMGAETSYDERATASRS